MGIVHATIYDAVVAIEGGYRPYAIAPTVPPNTSVEAAVAAAAHRVLVGRFHDQQAGLDDSYVAYLNGIEDGEAKANGILVGEEVGARMLLLRGNDGLDAIVPYVQRPPGAGVYEPTAPATPLGTRLPRVLPLALDSASRFRPDGPPALRSGEYTRDFDEVKQLGRRDSPARTAEQTAVALFWTDHDIPQWNRNLLRLASARRLTAIETARMLAMAHVAGGDAMIGCFDAKYHYLSWRPLHAIQRADTDRNRHTAADPAWQPLAATPNHPEYPSAHACHTTAIAEALESFFGPGHVRFSLDSLVAVKRAPTGDSEVVEEVNRSRLGGLPLPTRKTMDEAGDGSADSWPGTSSSRSTRTVETVRRAARGGRSRHARRRATHQRRTRRRSPTTASAASSGSPRTSAISPHRPSTRQR